MSTEVISNIINKAGLFKLAENNGSNYKILNLNHVWTLKMLNYCTL